MKPYEAVSFPNRSGKMLYGMLHEPDAARARGICILLLSPGIKGRVGPHRLYLKLAEPLVAAGFHVLRFDYYGLGDSEGELGERIMADMYNSIQGGRYVDDTIAAMDWMQKRSGIERYVGSGLCGGSISALLTATRDRRVDSLLGIGLPSTLEGGTQNFDRFMSRGQLTEEGRNYLQRIFRLESWQRFLSGRSGYLHIGRSLLELWFPSKAKPASMTPGTTPDNVNPLFAPAFLAMLRARRPMLLVFSSGDRHRFNFGEKFEERHTAAAARTGHGWRLHLIDGANHILSESRWIEEMLAVSMAWLDEHYPAPGRKPQALRA